MTKPISGHVTGFWQDVIKASEAPNLSDVSKETLDDLDSILQIVMNIRVRLSQNIKSFTYYMDNYKKFLEDNNLLHIFIEKYPR